MADEPDGTPPGAPGPRTVRVRQVLEDGVIDGTYSNVASITSSPAEFFLDFGRVVPGRQDVRVHARIIMTPAHAKRLAQALAEQVRRHEEAHGTIPGLPDDPGRKLGVH